MLLIDAYLKACPLDSEVIEVGARVRENRSAAAHESWNFAELLIIRTPSNRAFLRDPIRLRSRPYVAFEMIRRTKHFINPT